jgi:bifunctional non-homologous end joining protein LigD
MMLGAWAGETTLGKPPRKSRAIKRASDTKPERVASRAVVPRPADPRQASLFDLPPTWIAPCVPKLVRTAPSGPEWLHEIKHDGYRTIAVIDHGKVSLFTRRGQDWSARMPSIAQALAGLKVRSAVIDGEAIVAGTEGVSDFFALHAALAQKSAPHAALIAFDIMHLDGEDLRGCELEERRAILSGVLRKPAPWLQLSETIEGDGPKVWRAAAKMGLEGIVSKRRGSRYISGRSDSWRKTKCTITEHFAVLGFDPRRRSLRLARLSESGLLPCGSAGSGLSDADVRRIRAALDMGRPVIAEVDYRGLTPAGELRHPVIRGWHAG